MKKAAEKLLVLKGMVAMIDVHVVAPDDVGADDDDKDEDQEEKEAAVFRLPCEYEMEEIRAIGQGERYEDIEPRDRVIFGHEDFRCPTNYPVAVVCKSKGKEEEKKYSVRITEDTQKIDYEPAFNASATDWRGCFFSRLFRFGFHAAPLSYSVLAAMGMEGD